MRRVGEEALFRKTFYRLQWLGTGEAEQRIVSDGAHELVTESLPQFEWVDAEPYEYLLQPECAARLDYPMCTFYDYYILQNNKLVAFCD